MSDNATKNNTSHTTAPRLAMAPARLRRADHAISTAGEDVGPTGSASMSLIW